MFVRLRVYLFMHLCLLVFLFLCWLGCLVVESAVGFFSSFVASLVRRTPCLFYLFTFSVRLMVSLFGAHTVFHCAIKLAN